MKLIKKQLSLFALYTALGVFLYSCCDADAYELFEQTDAHVNVFGLFDRTEIDTIRGSFRLEMDLIQEIAMHNFQTPQLFNSAYATTCEKDPVNTIVKSSIVVSLDKAIEFNGNQIPANVDLISAIDDGNSAFNSAEQYESEALIRAAFANGFTNNALVPLDNYTFTISALTSDNRVLRGSKEVVIDL